MVDQSMLLSVLRDARTRLDEPNADVLGSGWDSVEDGRVEIDQLIARVEGQDIPEEQIVLLFAPTGKLQDTSIRSGWGDEFLGLAARADKALGRT